MYRKTYELVHFSEGSLNLKINSEGVIEVRSKKIRKVISGTVSAMMIAASIPAVASAADQQDRGNIGGYDYEMWNQNGQGQVSMNPGAGSFTCSWSNIENFLARMGKNYDSQKQNYKQMIISFPNLLSSLLIFMKIILQDQ